MTELAERIVAGELRAIARAATLIEARSQAGQDALKGLFPRTGRAMTVGVTGAGGAGKSTVVDRLIHLLRAQNRRTAVIAVDPTSPFTGGAILGDRIRMQAHHADPGVFIRSMATRGRLGGVAAATSDLMLLFDAAGYDAVIVETVGVGQDEVEVARIANVTVVVMAPGLGDDVQAMKAGIMEIADIFLINKCDLPGSERLEREIRSSVELATRTDGWRPPVVRMIATEGTGGPELLSAIEQFTAIGTRQQRGVNAWEVRLREMFFEKMLQRVPGEWITKGAEDVARHKRDPFSVVDEWAEAMNRREKWQS